VPKGFFKNFFDWSEEEYARATTIVIQLLDKFKPYTKATKDTNNPRLDLGKDAVLRRREIEEHLLSNYDDLFLKRTNLVNPLRTAPSNSTPA